MKRIIIYLLPLCCISCNHKQHTESKSVALTVLYDCTDLRQIQPNPEFILSFYGLDTERERDAYFRITTTTDMVLNPSKEVYLPKSEVTQKDNSNDDPYFREKKILAFYAEVRQAIKGTAPNTENNTTYEKSECFRTICREITLLEKKKYTHSILLAYTDLQEKSDIATVYGSSTIDTALIKKQFERLKLLPNKLTGLTVYVIFQPQDRKEDKKFMDMYGIYQNLLEQRGAIVQLKTENNPLNQIP